MDGGSWHCTGSCDQNHTPKTEIQKGKMVVWGGLTNSWKKKRSKRQSRKRKICPSECRVPKNRKAFSSLLAQWSMYSLWQQIWKTQQGSQDWKRSVFIPIPKKGNAKECSNYHTIALISYASKVILKILQARLQRYLNWELPKVQGGFRKGSEIRDQIANIRWITEKAREFQKNIDFCVTDYAIAFDCVDHNKL